MIYLLTIVFYCFLVLCDIEISYILDEKYDIEVRPGLHCAPLAHKTIGTFEQGVVRFSFGPFNTHEEIDYALKAIFEISREI